jgi:hypothetical protein
VPGRWNTDSYTGPLIGEPTKPLLYQRGVW